MSRDEEANNLSRGLLDRDLKTKIEFIGSLSRAGNLASLE